MKKYMVRFVRDFEVEIEAQDLSSAQQLAWGVIAQFPPETCKLLSVVQKRRGKNSKAVEAAG